MSTTFEQYLIDFALGIIMGNNYDINVYDIKRHINIGDDITVTTDDEFPVKDRSLSRHRYHGSKRDKKKHYDREINRTKRDYRLYYGQDLSSNGKSAKTRRREKEMELEVREYYGTPKLEKETYFTIDDMDRWCLESLEDTEFSKMAGKEPTMQRLEKEGIYIISPRADEIREEMYRLNRKEVIDEEMQIIGYNIVSDTEKIVATLPTVTDAVITAIMLCKRRYIKDYDIVPVKMYKEEQIKEIDELGFLPVPGLKRKVNKKVMSNT